VTPDEFKERMRGSSEKQVKAALALQKVAELESIEIEDSEIDEEYIEAAKRYGMEVDKFKESVPRKDMIRDLKLRAAAKVILNSAIAEEFTESSTEKSFDTTGKAPSKKTAAKKATDKKSTAKKTTKGE